MEIKNIEMEQKYIDSYNPGHDDIQMEYFIVGNNHTDYGRYKQAISEYNTHYNSIATSYIEHNKHTANIEIYEAEIEELQNIGGKVSEAKVKYKKIEIEEKQIANKTIEKQIQRNTNEMRKMLGLIKKYEKEIEGKDIKELEKEYHIERLKKLFILNTTYGGSNLSGVIDVVSSLPIEIQNNILPTNLNIGLLQ